MQVVPARVCSRERGSFIVEAALAWGVLLVIALLLLKASTNITSAQQWAVMQSVTDSFLTQETALASRFPFDDFKAGGSLWPTYPGMSSSEVVIGRLPGGRPIEATLKRTKHPDPNNLDSAGGTGTETTNPAQMETWKLQSFLTYQIANRDYIKSRTTLRTR